MKTFCWIVTILSCVIAGIQLFDTLLRSQSAPQQAAGAGLAIAIAVIPYVFSRAVSELSGEKKSKPLTAVEEKAKMYDAVNS
jgi:hypothetical protein